jgi:hypothetical protein
MAAIRRWTWYGLRESLVPRQLPILFDRSIQLSTMRDSTKVDAEPSINADSSDSAPVNAGLVACLTGAGIDPRVYQ